ncbi:MAG TPA: hypothetical protein VM580_00080, partial [Labilithrix sp.]|nr:hypothetical protein [Labilithrix sp.]
MQVRQALVTAVPLGLLMACASQRASFDDPKESTEETSPGGPGEPGGFDDKTPPADDKSEPNGRDPVTCEEAKWARSYVGCDYWPTVAPNVVQDVFDFAVAVANVGDTDAEVSVTGPGGVNEKVKVAAGSLEKIFLPWVGALKGPQLNGSQ